MIGEPIRNSVFGVPYFCRHLDFTCHNHTYKCRVRKNSDLFNYGVINISMVKHARGHQEMKTIYFF